MQQIIVCAYVTLEALFRKPHMSTSIQLFVVCTSCDQTTRKVQSLEAPCFSRALTRRNMHASTTVCVLTAVKCERKWIGDETLQVVRLLRGSCVDASLASYDWH